MNEVKNIDKYDLRMEKSMLDKLFFVDKIHFDSDQTPIFIDYGCANGALFKELYKFFPNAFFAGYDISKKQIQAMNDNLSKIKGLNFIGDTNFNSLIEKVRTYPDNSVKILIFNSVIHEIYSYGGLREVKVLKKFLDRFFYLFDYIVIRDMVPDERLKTDYSCDTDIYKVMRWINTHQTYDGKPWKELYEEFVKIWGPLEFKKNLVHFLLKYKYDDNWTREVRENYFPVFEDELMKLFDMEYREVAYRNHYTLSYTRDIIKKDFDIDLKDKTHLKLIIQTTTK